MGGGGADLVDIELGGLVGMAVDHGGALADHQVIVEGEQHQVAGLEQIGLEAVGMDRLVEDVGSDGVEL